MKKTLAILLAVVMAITLFTACGDKPAPTPDTKTGSVYYLNFKRWIRKLLPPCSR